MVSHLFGVKTRRATGTVRVLALVSTSVASGKEDSWGTNKVGRIWEHFLLSRVLGFETYGFPFNSTP